MKTRAFTILELTVSIAIASLVFFMLGAIFIAQGRYLAIENAIADTQYNAFQALDTVGLFTSSAKQVMASQTINGTVYTTGTSTVVLQLPSIDSNGDVVGGSYDYVAIGLDPSDSTRFIYALDAAASSFRKDGTYIKAQLVDKLIFRYNAVVQTSATAIDLYIRTSETARGQTIKMPLGKIYYLGAS